MFEGEHGNLDEAVVALGVAIAQPSRDFAHIAPGDGCAAQSAERGSVRGAVVVYKIIKVPSPIDYQKQPRLLQRGFSG